MSKPIREIMTYRHTDVSYRGDETLNRHLNELYAKGWVLLSTNLVTSFSEANALLCLLDREKPKSLAAIIAPVIHRQRALNDFYACCGASDSSPVGVIVSTDEEYVNCLACKRQNNNM